MNKLLVLPFLLLFHLSVQAQMFKTYQDGYYFNETGEKISGLVSFMPYGDKIFFKKSKEEDAQKIDIADVKAIVTIHMVNDSLTVLTEDNKDSKKYFAKLMIETPYMRFYYKFKASYSSGAPLLDTRTVSNGVVGNNQPATHNIYTVHTPPVYFGVGQIIMYADGDTTHQLTKHNYVEILTRALADAPAYVQQVQSKDFKFDEVQELLIHYNMEDHSAAK